MLSDGVLVAYPNPAENAARDGDKGVGVYTCRDGKPIWSLTSFGDTGNGFLSAIGIVQALWHRDRTGEGQFLTTNITAACLLNTSYAWIDEHGHGVERPHVDRLMLGTDPLHRLYPTTDDWLCLAVDTDAQWAAMTAALGDPRLAERRFADADGRTKDADDLAALLADVLGRRPATEWFTRLDTAGVPCEVEDAAFVQHLFTDPQYRAGGLVTTTQQAQVGRFEQFGHLWSFSDTPSRVAGPPLIVGHDTVAILTELGLEQVEIDALLADGVAKQATLTQERAT